MWNVRYPLWTSHHTRGGVPATKITREIVLFPTQWLRFRQLADLFMVTRYQWNRKFLLFVVAPSMMSFLYSYFLTLIFIDHFYIIDSWVSGYRQKRQNGSKSFGTRQLWEGLNSRLFLRLQLCGPREHFTINSYFFTRNLQTTHSNLISGYSSQAQLLEIVK